MKRRHFLTSTAGLVALAGCTSNETGNPNQQADPTEATPTTDTTTPPTTTTAAPAEFELASVNAPETAEIRESASYSFTVKNVGGQTGTFETTIRSREGSGSWIESDPWQETIDPGQTVRLSSQSFSYDTLTSVDFEITAFNKQFSIQFVGAKQAWGESYTVGDKYSLTAIDVQFKNAYTYEYSGYEYTEKPSDGNKWAFVTFRARNVSNSPQRLPTKYGVALIAGNSQYDYSATGLSQGIYEGGQVQPDIVREGVIIYEVPSGVSKSDLQLTYTETMISGDISVTWTSNA